VVQATGDGVGGVTAGGDPQLGGAELDAALLNALRTRLPETADGALELRAMEKAKIALSTSESAEVKAGESALTLTRAEFEELLAPLLDRMVATVERVLSSTGLNAQSVDEVLLVGAQGRTPRIVERLAAALGKPVRSDEGMGLNLEGAVAMGAALVGDGIIQAERAAPGIRFSGALTSPISLGIRGGAMQRILERGTRLPSVKTLSFPVSGASPLSLSFFQGDDAGIFLGAATIQLERDGELHLHFHLSPDGMASVDVTLPGGEAISLVLDRGVAPREGSAIWPELRSSTPPRGGFWTRLFGRE